MADENTIETPEVALTPSEAADNQSPAQADDGNQRRGRGRDDEFDGEGADGFYLSAPVQPTTLLMVRDQTGEQVSMDFAITHQGGAVTSDDGAPTLAARTGLDSSGCQVALASAAHRLFLW